MARTQTPTTAIRWADPPESATRTTSAPDKYADLAAEMRKNVNRWAVVDTVETGSQAYRLTSGIKKGKLGFGPGFEARSHKDGDKVVNVYARFTGETLALTVVPGTTDHTAAAEPQAAAK